MNEEEFDSTFDWHPFRSADAMNHQTTAARATTLGIRLWGKTSEDLRRQLLLRYPEIPSGYDPSDFRRLEKSTRTIAASAAGPQVSSWLARQAASGPAIVIDGQRFTEWEAKYEIVRRAIEYLKKS